MKIKFVRGLFLIFSVFPLYNSQPVVVIRVKGQTRLLHVYPTLSEATSSVQGVSKGWRAEQNVCSSGFNPCDNSADCIQMSAKVIKCECLSGFDDNSFVTQPPSNLIANGTYCVDVNECSLSNYTCGEQKNVCINTNGSYTCNCASGYQYNATSKNCTDINECLNVNAKCGIGTARCRNLIGSYMCTCRTGFTYNDTVKLCLDVNECTTSSCDVNAVCRNNIGSYTCTCLAGFTGNGKLCQDIDECKDPVVSAACSINGECKNSFGSYQCNCLIGYMKGTINQHKTCIDINECMSDQTCSWMKNFNCTNTLGSFYCSCMPGYAYDSPSRKCLGDNECLDYPCHPHATCTDKPIGYYCNCNQGYTGNGHLCVDIDECGNSTVCGVATETCTNSDGSYVCSCASGYNYNSELKLCADIDDCATSLVCGNETHQCINLDGGFQCNCEPGYFNAGINTACGDENECIDDNICGAEADCINIEGSYTCSCDSGLTYQNKSCTDTDECLDRTHDCSLPLECENTFGSFICVNRTEVTTVDNIESASSTATTQSGFEFTTERNKSPVTGILEYHTKGYYLSTTSLIFITGFGCIALTIFLIMLFRICKRSRSTEQSYTLKDGQQTTIDDSIHGVNYNVEETDPPA